MIEFKMSVFFLGYPKKKSLTPPGGTDFFFCTMACIWTRGEGPIKGDQQKPYIPSEVLITAAHKSCQAGHSFQSLRDVPPPRQLVRRRCLRSRVPPSGPPVAQRPLPPGGRPAQALGPKESAIASRALVFSGEGCGDGYGVVHNALNLFIGSFFI